MSIETPDAGAEPSKIPYADCPSCDPVPPKFQYGKSIIVTLHCANCDLWFDALEESSCVIIGGFLTTETCASTGFFAENQNNAGHLFCSNGRGKFPSLRSMFGHLCL